MFFYISKFSYLLFHPYSLILFFLIIAVPFIRPRRLRLFFACALALLLLLSLPLSGHLLIGRLEQNYPPLPLHKVPSADVAVVLLGILRSPTVNDESQKNVLQNGGRYNDRRYNGGPIEFGEGVDRLLLAEELLRSGKVGTLLLCGGSHWVGAGSLAEAPLIRRWLLRRGHRAEQIVIEARSRNTVENIQAATAIVRRHNWKRILLVTSAFHMERSLLLLRKAGLSALPLPNDYRSFSKLPWPEAAFPSVSGLAVSSLALREYIALLVYWLLGYI